MGRDRSRCLFGAAETQEIDLVFALAAKLPIRCGMARIACNYGMQMLKVEDGREPCFRPFGKIKKEPGDADIPDVKPVDKLAIIDPDGAAIQIVRMGRADRGDRGPR